jgi:quinol monooxygenase YgiN
LRGFAVIAIIATFDVKPDASADFETIFKDLAAQVRIHEPGNLMYMLTRVKQCPNRYRVVERYVDKDALKAHGSAEYFTVALSRLSSCCQSDPAIEMLQVVA